MPGRPTKLSPELQARLVMALRARNYLETACAYAGVHKDTVYEWLKRGARERELRDREDAVLEQEAARPRRRNRRQQVAHGRRQAEIAARREREEPFLAFSDAIEKAMADAEVAMVAKVVSAGEREWTAAAWWLERRFPERWGRRQTTTLQGPDGGPIPVEARVKPDLGKLSDAELAQLEAMLEKAAPADGGDAR